MLCEELRNGGDSLYVVTANRYGSRLLTRGDDMPVFVTLDTATVCYYEGGATAQIRRQSTFAYENQYGNLVRRTDSSTHQPLVVVTVGYHADPGSYRVDVPNSVEIFDANANRYRKRTTENDNLGRITAFRDWYDNTHYLATRLQYDQYGNVTTMRSPNTTVHYTYDNYVHTYPTAITDTFGVTSQMQDYDFRFGIPRTIVDQAGSRMEYTLDEWGRTVTIRGPKEIAAQVPYTIKHTYSGREEATGSTRPRAVSMAVTEHYDPQHPQNLIKTYTYCDGLGRIVQTRKEAAVNGVEKLVISGHTVVDALGRTVATYYPTEIHKDSTRFRFITDNSAPASTVTYDVLDRPIEQTAPDGSTTGFEYGFAYNNDLSKMLFSTVITDANGHSSTELKDVDGKPWVIQPAGQPFVYFDYNAAGDNTRTYASTGEWERRYTYDLLGRKTTYMEGQLFESFTYDGGNLATHTYNWMENGNSQVRTTRYHYTAHRLDSVCYDDALTTIYHYNAAGQPDSVYDESGLMAYEYGNMGEVTKETRIYALPFLSQPIALSTQFSYDSWGRVQSITYPDGEVVHYAYDLGGQLERMYSSSYTYLDNVAYDRFGAKVSQEYGNGIATNYSYDNTTRRLSGITTANQGVLMSDIAYTYDPVGNVTQVTSTCPWLQNQSFTEDFTYDSADQLTVAQESQNNGYQLTVNYGHWGKVNNYDLAQTDFINNTSTGDSRLFTYPSDPNNLQVAQTMFAPEQCNGTADILFSFGINGSLRKRETMQPQQHTEYYLFNSQGNLKAYSDDVMSFAYYGYDAANTRTYKLSLYNTNVWINGQPQALHMQLQSAMFYPNSYLNFDAFGNYTKHYYNGTERIASRLGDKNTFIAVDFNEGFESRRQQAEEQFRNDIQDLISESAQIDMPAMADALSLQGMGTPNDVFYYHINHLGNTAFVTDQNQTITQGFLYAPFGEITTEYNVNFGNNMLPKYTFNAKELDEETGMYYYEARYYNPPTFISRDPHFERYFWTSPYGYCANNPLKYVDPTGCDLELNFFLGKNKENTAKVFTSIINDGLEGQFEAYYKKGKKGNYSLQLKATENGGDLSKMSAEAQSFYGNLVSMIEDHNTTAVMDVVYGSSDVHVGNYIKNKIDIADVNQFDDMGKGEATKQGKLIHELVEQFGKAKAGYKKFDDEGRDYNHRRAINVENKVNGTIRKDLSWNRGWYTSSYTDKKRGTSAKYSYNTKYPILKVIKQ